MDIHPHRPAACRRRAVSRVSRRVVIGIAAPDAFELPPAVSSRRSRRSRDRAWERAAAASGAMEGSRPPLRTRASRNTSVRPVSTPGKASRSFLQPPGQPQERQPAGAATAAASSGTSSWTRWYTPSDSPAGPVPPHRPTKPPHGAGPPGMYRAGGLPVWSRTLPQPLRRAERHHPGANGLQQLAAVFTGQKKQRALAGGSSRILRRAFCACSVIFCASASRNTRLGGASLGRM